MVGTSGFEPLTSSVSRKRSNQLSYAPVCVSYQSKSNYAQRQTYIPPAPTLQMPYDGFAPIKMHFLTQFRAAPNLLTLMRLFLIPFLVIAIMDGRYHLAFTLFVIAGFSDGFDGLLARALSQRTVLGQYLDPIADKLLLSTLFLVLTHMGLVPRYVTVLVFSRDLGILLISTLLFATGALRDFRPSLLGKLNTLVQILGLTLVLVDQVWPAIDHLLLRRDLLRAIAILAPVSAAQYAWIVLRRVNAPAPQSN
jgi:cardiolipin synthase (CMP-forming)